MQRYVGGDDAAFVALYERIQPRLRAFFSRRVSTAGQVEDLTQQTFLKLHAARQTFRCGEPVLPWVYAIAHRLLIDTYRRSGRELVQDTHEISLSTLNPVQEAMARETCSRMQAVLEALPPRQLLAFERVRYEGRSHREVADELHTSVSAVKSLVHRAHETLRSACICEE